MIEQNIKSEVQERKIKNYLDNEVKDFAQYVIRTRAMPNIMDGLRPGARKIIWAALTGDLKNSNKIKMPSLLGDAFKLHYNHGDASLLNTIIQLASKHVYKYNPLEVVGQIATLRVPKCSTAPRYLHIKKTKYLDFFKYDNELLERLTDDGDYIEPKYFLPIIPIALLWRTNSPGYGFSFRCFSYGLDEVIDNCIKAINNGTCISEIDDIPLIPTIEGIAKENMVYNANKNSWYNVGKYHLNYELDILTVTDLPFNVPLEKYEEHLNYLLEKNIIIKFTDYSQDGNIKYVIKFAKGRLKSSMENQWKFFQTFKLYSKIKPDTLSFIDQDGKTMLFFQTPYEVIDCFVRKRLIIYRQRKTKTVATIKNEILNLETKIKFIKLVTEDKLKINKRPIVDIKKDLDFHNLPYEVLKINIEKLTKEEIENMTKDIVEKKKYLDYITNTTIETMYISDLIDFKNKYSEIKKIS